MSVDGIAKMLRIKPGQPGEPPPQARPVKLWLYVLWAATMIAWTVYVVFLYQ